MIKLYIVVIATALVCGCSFFNFFSYEEDTGLHVIERPKGYDNAKFGIELAPTSTPESDMFAVSAGRGHPTLFYRLSDNGDLVDVLDPMKQYLADSEDATEVSNSGTGAALAGLPHWGSGLRGCVAIGEPDANKVVINCDPGNSKKGITLGESDEKEFGHKLAAIRPTDGGYWLLATAAEHSVWVYSNHERPDRNHSEAFVARAEGGARAGEVIEVAGGRLEERFFVAVATFNEKSSRHQVYIFVQREANSQEVSQVACIEHSKEPGFGGTMTTGDLDGDDKDELIVSGAQIAKRENKVYIYDVAELVPAPDETDVVNTCVPDTIEHAAVLEPGEGDLDVECGEDCDFGTTLVAGDIATDVDGMELMVGAPGAKVEGVREAGAIYVYSTGDEYRSAVELSGQVSDSTPEQGHRFGGGLTVASMAGRNELLVGVTGKGQVVIAFCTGVGTDVEEGGDVTTNASGSLVSTRCRP
ncbi:MAG: hypothetical protein GY854_14775 [Deltaproteobacteria bacterium]|nr:hypothetical protein [Deltaproteobacteria bacterium]